MSGHSKWATIKRKKSANDAKRGKIFSKLIKEITIAARMGGGSIVDNPRLRNAVETAKAENMPKDNIERAIKKGTGDLPGVIYEESVIEGYGPGGVAIMVELATDNKNRSISDIKHIMTRNNGHIGEVGCVAWTFDQKGVIIIPKNKIDEDTLMGEAMEAGADDIISDEDSDIYEVTTAPKDLQQVKDHFTQKKVPFERAELTRIPKSEIDLAGKEAEQMLRLMEALEDNDDVQKVYANFNISQAELTKIEEALG